MKSSAIVGGLSMLDAANLGREIAAVSSSSDPDARSPQFNGLLPTIEIDIEFEDLEGKTAPQSDTSYLDRFVPYL